jgi:hypothetical protein
MGTIDRSHKIGIISRMVSGAKNLFKMIGKSSDMDKSIASDPYKRRDRRQRRKNRHFDYFGEDNLRHTVRQGKPFPVRPKGHPYMVIATPDNRVLLSVR